MISFDENNINEELIEKNWDSISYYWDKTNRMRKDFSCYQCDKRFRYQDLQSVGGKGVCPDCIADLNLKVK